MCRVNRSGANIIGSISRDGREALRDGKLVLLRQDRAAAVTRRRSRQENFESVIEKVTAGAARTGARGASRSKANMRMASRAWLPFTLRLYFYAGGDALRVLHTIVFDGDE